MKRAILGMSEENYDFEQNNGSLHFSCESVELSFYRDEQYEGKFEITGANGAWAEGYVYSNHFRMQCLTKEFSGHSVEMMYCFDSTGMVPGETISGEFRVVSCFGEYEIPFSVHYEQEFLFSSMGPIKNLFHFANLAKTDWQEAVKLFYSHDFAKILRGNDTIYHNTYRALSRHFGNQRNVEAFLIAVKKKVPITYSADMKEIVIDDVDESICREIVITRSGWGYLQLSVSADESFVKFERETFDENDFLGNVVRIPFYVNREDLHIGKNSSRITITDQKTESEVDLIIHHHPHVREREESAEWKLLTAQLMRNYLRYRVGGKDTSAWAKESLRMVEKMNGQNDKDLGARLYQVQLLLVTQRFGEAKWITERIEELLKRGDYPTEYEAYYLYLTALCDKENAEYIDKVASKIKKMYHKENDNWRIAWILLYLQEDLLKNPLRKWEFLEEQYNRGANTPILYVEAMSLLIENPSFLMKMGSYEMQLLRFMIQHDKISNSIAERIQFLCSREREYQRRIFDILRACYKKYPNKELLQMICAYLMKGNKTGPQYFPWYEAGVKEELRLTRLYDFYLMSIDLHFQGELPKIVMMYFAYQNNLPYDRMAFLYAKVLACRTHYPEIALSYAESIDSFIREQLGKGRINDDLAYLYRRAVSSYMLDAKITSDLAPMMFMKRIHVTLPEARFVIAIHKKVTEEKTVPINDGVAYIPIYSKDYLILLEDSAGNRTVDASYWEAEDVEFPEQVREEVLVQAGERIGVLIYTCEGKRDFVTINEENVYGHARLLRSEWITPEFQKEILVNLVRYYFDCDYVRELDELLTDTNPKVLNREERRELVRILVARGMYDTAFSWVCTYGPETAQDKTLLRLCSRLLERRDFEEDTALLETAAYVFRCGKYDQNILSYLVRYFGGGTKEMKELWGAAQSFGVEDYALLERILVQMLFCDTFIGDKMTLYAEFIKNNGNCEVEKAFLSKCAYDYFVKESPTGELIFERIAQLIKQGEMTNRIPGLALLRFYAEREKERWDLELIAQLVTSEVRKQYCFPMFSVFGSVVPDISLMLDRTYIEYRGSTHSRVILHYVLEKKNGEEEYRKEEMTNLYGGIFVKGFVLFYGETIQYYITEENGNCEQLTQSSTLQKTEGAMTGESSRFAVLNDIMLSREIKDYGTCEQLLCDYAKQNYIVRRLFESEDQASYVNGI